MLDKIFWGLLETQTETLKSSPNNKVNITLLETAKLLLSYINDSTEAMNGYDKFEIRELFSAFADVGESTTSFFEKNKDILDPAALSGSIGVKLNDSAEKITNISNAIKELQSKESDLIKREKELSEINKIYQELTAKVAELKATRDTMTPEIIEQMRQQIDDYKQEIDKSSKDYDKLRKKLNSLEKELSQIKSELEKDIDEEKNIGSEVLKVITKHYDTLKIIYESHNMDVDKITAKIQQYQDIYYKMETQIQENTDELSVYEAYLGENSKIVDSMKKYGVKSLADVVNDIEQIKQTIDEDLKAYDFIIKKVILHEEEIKEGIERKQGKMV